jgi:hypothetical protein
VEQTAATATAAANSEADPFGMTTQKDNAKRQCKKAELVVFAGDVADCEVDEGEAGAEGSHETFHALDALFVVAYAALEVVEAAGLAYAHQLVHLAFEDV